MAPRCEFVLTDLQIKDYHRHGFVVVRDVLSPSVIEAGWRLYDAWLEDIISQWRDAGELVAELTPGARTGSVS
jgi:hypothetical protein